MRNQLKSKFIILSVICLLLTGCTKENDNVKESDVSSDIVQENSDTGISDELHKDQNDLLGEEAIGGAEMVEVKEGKIVEEVINSEAIGNNIIKQKSERTIYVYLPPTYDQSDKAYPVAYFLHGYGDNSKNFINSVKDSLDEAFSIDSSCEFILVVLDGNNNTGGSFYVNSPVSGNWEDFVVEEVVNTIDTNYRTIKNSASRSITGYSMGGYGAINIAIHHPDIYGTMLVFCPGIYADGDIESMWNSWTGWDDVKRSYAQAFSPRMDEYPYGNRPEFSGTPEDDEIIKQWDNGYGNWAEKLDTYLTLDQQLIGIQINYSNGDGFSWIPDGCVAFAELLDERNIEYEINEFSGGHIVPSNSMTEYYIPFFKKYMKFDE